MIKKLLKYKILILCFIVAFICITICSKNSFLYPFNNWPDENAFMTVGASWFHGIIPYKGIFEQKGPLLYFIFMICYMVSNHSFIGVYIFELICFTVCLYYISKIVSLYLKEKYIYLILPIFGAIITSSPFFAHGGSAEELCFPLLAYMLYTLLNYDKFNIITKRSLFFNGLFAGCVAMIKFNLLGFWFIFMAGIFASLIFKKEVKKSFISCFIFLAGMGIPIFTFALYFYLNHGLEELIRTYILFNSTGYGNTSSMFDKIEPILRLLFNQTSVKFIIFNLIYLGMIFFCFSKHYIKNIITKITIVLIYIVGGMGVYFGLYDFVYYFLILTPYIIFGLIVIMGYFDRVKKFKFNILAIISIVVSIIYLSSSNNIYYMKYKKSDLPQYSFARIINKKKDAKILNYGFLDGGFYFASSTLPSTMYFQSLNAVVPGMSEELDNKIKKQYFDYIIVRIYENHTDLSKVLTDNYKVIKKQTEVLENIEFTYILFERKNGK